MIRTVILALLLSLSTAACTDHGGKRTTIESVAHFLDGFLDESADIAYQTTVRVRGESIQTAIDKAAFDGRLLSKPERDARIVEAATAAAAAFDGGPLDTAATLVIRTRNAYAAAMDAADWFRATGELTKFLAAYDALRLALGSAGDRLPVVPKVIVDVLKTKE